MKSIDQSHDNANIDATSTSNNNNSVRGAPWSVASRLQRTGAFSWRPLLRPSQEDRPIPTRPYQELCTWKVV